MEKALAQDVIAEAPSLVTVLDRALAASLEWLGLLFLAAVVILGIRFLLTGSRGRSARLRRIFPALLLGGAIALSGVILFRLLTKIFS